MKRYRDEKYKVIFLNYLPTLDILFFFSNLHLDI